MIYILPFILLILLLIEASITTVPVVFLFLLLLTVFKKSPWVFVIAFFAGLLMDFLLLRSLGMTSMVYLLILFLVTLYERKFEIATPSFVGFAAFFGSLIYLLVFQNALPILQALVSTVLAVGVVQVFFKKNFKEKKIVV